MTTEKVSRPLTTRWSAEDLRLISAAKELEIAVRRPDGSLRQWVPIWVVCAGEQVYVRTWHRRDTGWFGQAVHAQRARIRVPGVEADITVEDIADTSAQVTADVSQAYRTKYDRGGADSMVNATAVATTLRLSPE